MSESQNTEDIYSSRNKSNVFHDYIDNYDDKKDVFSENSEQLSFWNYIVYYLTLIFVAVMPFLYSRLTTENFLTPKEFFSKIVLVIIGGILCYSLFTKREIKIAKTSLDMPLFLFFGFCVLSVIWNFNGASAIRDLREVFSVLLLFPIILNSFKKRWQIEILLWVVVFTGIATATIGIMETYNLYFKFDSSGIHYVKDDVLKKIIDPNAFYIPLFPQLASPDYYMGSVVSTFGNRNYLGTFVMFVAFVPLAFFFYYKRNLLMKVISLVLFGWLAYGLYTTRCRAALIGLGVGLLFMFIVFLINDKGLRLLKKNKLFFGFVCGLVLLGLLVSAKTIQSDTMWDKLKLTFTLAREKSNTYERMWVWHGNDKAFTENLFRVMVGQGFGSFKHFFPLKQGAFFGEKNMETFTAVTFRQAHNDWIQVFSELGIIGMVLFLFILKRLFGAIQLSLRRTIFSNFSLSLEGEHIVLIALGAALVSQLFASLPDFPFHRIETAVFAVLFMSLIMLIAETDYLQKPLEYHVYSVDDIKKGLLIFAVALCVILNTIHEFRCFTADKLVRQAEMAMTYYSKNPEAMQGAKNDLKKAIELDPLPGDPYNKLASWYEIVDNDPGVALRYAEKASSNINFNARSTYHSIVFRKLHIYYHVLNDLPKAFEEAVKGLELTAGDARSIYYLYGGKIAADILRTQIPMTKEDYERYRTSAEKYLVKAAKYEPYRLQSMASLAIYYTQFQNWTLGYDYGKAVSNACNDSDPTILNCLAICCENTGKTAEGLEWMKKALRLAPKHPIFNRDIGKIYKKLGDFEKAKYHYEVCVAASDCPESIRAAVLTELNAMK